MEEQNCSICWDKCENSEKLHCGHFVHIECLKKTINPECPICRTPLKGVPDGVLPSIFENKHNYKKQVEIERLVEVFTDVIVNIKDEDKHFIYKILNSDITNKNDIIYRFTLIIQALRYEQRFFDVYYFEVDIANIKSCIRESNITFEDKNDIFNLLNRIFYVRGDDTNNCIH